MFLMSLGLKNRPVVPHNLIPAQESPVPLLKFQMAPRHKLVMSSGPRKRSTDIHVRGQPELHTHRECGRRFHPLLHTSYIREYWSDLVSRLVDITAGGDFLGLCDQKSLYKHVQFWTVTELWAFFNSRTRPRVNRILRNQLTGVVLNLAAYLLRCQHYFRPLTRAVHN